MSLAAPNAGLSAEPDVFSFPIIMTKECVLRVGDFKGGPCHLVPAKEVGVVLEPFDAERAKECGTALFDSIEGEYQRAIAVAAPRAVKS